MALVREQERVAMPEFIGRRRDRHVAQPWQVEGGSAARGEAWADLDKLRMRVPFGDDDASRAIRAHELMHVRVSPTRGLADCDVFDGLEVRTVQCAEEFRVNTLLTRAGFDTTELRDGSEVVAGERIVARGDWAEAVNMVGATAGTKACKDFLRGVRKSDPEWAKALREVEKALTKAARKFSTSSMADTAECRIGDRVLPRGFATATRQFATILRTATESVKTDEETGETEVSVEGVKDRIGPRKRGEARGPREFARLILDTEVALTRRVPGHIGRKRVAVNVGRNPRRIHRMLVDPERRVFDRNIRGQGGVVVIDQSGSMHLSEKDLWDLLEAAPGCTVIGYSHEPGSTTTPNVWVLAENGKVCDAVHKGNGGNGVDGPALEFALSKRKRNEAVIWVCDGLVTDSHDGFYRQGAEQCAELVIKNRIHQVEDVEKAVEALRKVKAGERLATQAVGQIASTRAWAIR